MAEAIGDGVLGDAGPGADLTTSYKRKRIMAAVVARMREILTTNDYETDIGAHVFDHKPDPFQETEIPGMDIRETDTTERAIGAEWHRLDVTIRAIQTGYSSAGDLVRDVWADASTACAVDSTWGGIAEDTGPVDAKLAQIAVGDKYFPGVEVSFSIDYSTGIGNVYE